ncbi:unnamed protein product [Callosobruchus maculatus]|uniref:Uncharacterized protein n=1 Tax=Callosobruchus maculatus TaxID=64391 RepID=A0A653DD78_CALMS|nr:unnamed protein product [Callosobruchus maculatus]
MSDNDMDPDDPMEIDETIPATPIIERRSNENDPSALNTTLQGDNDSGTRNQQPQIDPDIMEIPDDEPVKDKDQSNKDADVVVLDDDDDDVPSPKDESKGLDLQKLQEPATI